MINNLPIEIVCMIFDYCGPYNYYLIQVCRDWRKIFSPNLDPKFLKISYQESKINLLLEAAKTGETNALLYLFKNTKSEKIFLDQLFFQRYNRMDARIHFELLKLFYDPKVEIKNKLKFIILLLSFASNFDDYKIKLIELRNKLFIEKKSSSPPKIDKMIATYYYFNFNNEFCEKFRIKISNKIFHHSFFRRFAKQNNPWELIEGRERILNFILKQSSAENYINLFSHKISKYCTDEEIIKYILPIYKKNNSIIISSYLLARNRFHLADFMNKSLTPEKIIFYDVQLVNSFSIHCTLADLFYFRSIILNINDVFQTSDHNNINKFAKFIYKYYSCIAHILLENIEIDNWELIAENELRDSLKKLSFTINDNMLVNWIDKKMIKNKNTADSIISRGLKFLLNFSNSLIIKNLYEFKKLLSVYGLIQSSIVLDDFLKTF